MEIIARGKAGSVWVQGGFMNWNGVPHILTSRIGEMIPVRKETVSIATGKKDKHGTHVFPGDIVRNHFDDVLKAEGFPDYEDFLILYDKEKCAFQGKSFQTAGDFGIVELDDIGPDFEVIGNIHDKPKKRKAKSVS